MRCRMHHDARWCLALGGCILARWSFRWPAGTHVRCGLWPTDIAFQAERDTDLHNPDAKQQLMHHVRLRKPPCGTFDGRDAAGSASGDEDVAAARSSA